MWFGESEKLIKGIFDNYRKAVRESKAAPILLFNEADAVLGKRQQNGNNRLAQTENAMQNILLQEMERLEGILIATTNLTQNLDKAFERRPLQDRVPQAGAFRAESHLAGDHAGAFGRGGRAAGGTMRLQRRTDRECRKAPDRRADPARGAADHPRAS